MDKSNQSIWNISDIQTSEQNKKFRISSEKETISNRKFLELLKDNSSFRSFYNEFLCDLGFDAFFWENKPITTSKLDEAYECNIINSDFLAQKSPDFDTFSSYFKKDKQVVSFSNLGNDAQLIAPCPVKENQGYAHIGSFIRNAPSEQIHKLWKQTGAEMLDHICDEPRWLSTSGLGIFWLHIRIDTIPKYYQTEEYKQVQ